MRIVAAMLVGLLIYTPLIIWAVYSRTGAIALIGVSALSVAVWRRRPQQKA